MNRLIVETSVCLVLVFACAGAALCFFEALPEMAFRGHVAVVMGVLSVAVLVFVVSSLQEGRHG